jgi:hypothetical protein
MAGLKAVYPIHEVVDVTAQSGGTGGREIVGSLAESIAGRFIAQ